MKKLLIKAALNILGNWLNSKVKNEKLKLLFLFQLNAVSDIAEILTDSEKDDSAQLEKYAESKLPEVVELFGAFLTEKQSKA